MRWGGGRGKGRWRYLQRGRGKREEENQGIRYYKCRFPFSLEGGHPCLVKDHSVFLDEGIIRPISPGFSIFLNHAYNLSPRTFDQFPGRTFKKNPN